jgi:hypothetical protein
MTTIDRLLVSIMLPLCVVGLARLFIIIFKWMAK